MRHWNLHHQAHRRAERSQWRHTLAVVNTIVGVLGGDPIELDELQGNAKPPDRDAYDAWKGRNIDWISRHTAEA